LWTLTDRRFIEKHANQMKNMGNFLFPTCGFEGVFPEKTCCPADQVVFSGRGKYQTRASGANFQLQYC